MKRYRERRVYPVNPHDILLGYTGELRSNNRLVPLRITKKYKNALKQEELLRNEQILEMSQLIIKYENLVSIINSLSHENEKNLNCSLLLELEKKKAILKKRLLFLKSKLDLLPATLDKSMQNLFNSGSKYVHSNETFSSLKTKKKPRFTSFPKTTAPKTHDVTSSWFGSVKSQILVRDKNLQLHTINIDLFSNGENLLKVMSMELGEEVKSYNVIFGTKQVDKAKTLWDQGIYHGSTVDLNVRFHGGMDRKGKKKKKTKKNNNIAGNADQPEFWTKHQVVEWIDNFCKEHEIDEKEVSKLRLQNGKGLNMLLEDEWKKRSPNYGDVLFRMWNELIKKDSTRETDTKKEVKTNEVCLDEKSPTQVEPAEEKASIVSEEPHDICEEDDIGVKHEVNESTPQRGPFGKVDDLKDLVDSVSLYDLGNGPSANPDFGSVISITGVCSKETSWRYGTVGTMLIRDDPPGAASVFSQLKVDIRGSNQNQDLNYGAVESLLKKIKPGVSVAVRGRVERLEDENASSDPEHEMLKFKLVVDSDDHALVYVENNTGLFTRQFSQPWYAQQGVYPFIVDDKRLHEGDIIQKTDIEENPIRRVFCKSSVSDSEIKKIALAFKNSFDGDIFVGVEESGKVTGMKFTEGELLKWREQISMTIGQILPGSNEEVSICASDEEARENIRKKCFVSVMKLDECTQKNVEKVRVIARIHVPKGTARLYFSKQTDIHAFVRVGAENKRFNDYEDLFSRLESLSSRRIVPIADEQSYVEEQYKEAIEHMKGLQKLRVLKSIKYESQEREFKMIFGDKPVEIIEKKYFSQYTCGFLNSLGGSIFFGVQEDEKSKQGHIVGIVVPLEKREEFVRNSITTFSKFYPPVKTSQFRITFHDVSVSAELALILRYHKTRVSRSGKCVLLRGPPEEIGAKWTKFIKDKLPGQLCRVIPVKPQCFCIVTEKLDFSSEQFMGIIELFEKENSKVKLDAMDENELKSVLKDLCIIEIKVKRSPYPIHMVKPIETFVFDEHETLHQLKQDKLMYRFALDSRSEFDVEKFLNHVQNFDPSGNSYVLVASPFDLPSNERDLYGLVIPKWTLTIDLDQQLKQIGHLYQVFEDLNDLHQTERNRFVRTSQDHKLDLNPDHGICWLAARGYEEIAKSLSEESHGKWNMTHRGPLRSLLEAELTSCVKPNLLNIVVLWDERQQALVDSLRTILEDILSINGDRTAITFVCSTPESQSDVSNKLVKPLQDNYWEIMEEERVHVAPPYVLAQFLSYKLPAPYRPEDDYQVPHKKFYRQIPQTLPETLPQRLRQNVHGHLKMMYMTKERKPDVASLDKERKQFYSGSEITNMGLRGEIGIKRSKMATLEKEFRHLLNDKKSHVSLIFVKADRGAGSTTMCLQFLFQCHKEYPCAQLIEIRDGLVSYIEDINKATNLPLLLLVDQEIANLQDFLDFKKEVERRNINVILLLIEPAEVFCKKKPTSPRRPNKTRMKSARDSSLYGTSPFRVVELRRELENKEVEELTKELIAIDKGKEAKLTKLKERSKQQHQHALRTFAHFSLTAFGNKFSGLKEYVEFRLGLADEKLKAVLAFLSLTHVFTDCLFPASALAGFLDTKKVILEIEFGNSYLRELLSPPTDENDSRRISFLEVAEEILLQLAEASSSSEEKYWSFIRSVSVQMAKDVLSVNITTKKIDRLARKLFVTSEYESEKFSLLVRSMKEDYPNTARDTLIDLVEVFQRHTSFRAHLLAHLAKYHMNVNNNFADAKPLIEEAIKDQEDDVLLHHIHGDIIRLQVLVLKSKKNIDMNTIVSRAIESSECFEIVRNKRPHMSHGYVSDAMVRITVMRAAIKKIGGKKDTSFVDYLIGMIDEIKERENGISLNERYLLTLIPDAHQYLDEGVVEFEHKEKWKEHFLECIGELTNLKILCDKLKEEESFFSRYSGWLHDICVETQVLHNALEIETKDLSPDEIESRIKNIEECGSSSKFSERTMKFWIRYSRQRKSVPRLEDVRKRVMEWIAKAKKRGGISPHAEFYNYVINVVAALKDPNDREKMDKAEKLIKRQQSNKYNKKDVVLPLEWLHPKRGRHINSIDSLLNHDDLVKDTARYSGAGKRRPGREVIEGSLFEKQITKWEGTVKEIRNDWHGTIVFKRRLEVRFVPQNVQPSMPTTGDTVRFCLSFDRYGLSAWTVVRAAEYNQVKNLSEVISSDEDSSSEHSEGKDDADSMVLVTPPLYASEISREKLKTWDDYIGQRMQGVVISTNSDNGFGFLKHPDVVGQLFFHAAQLVNPVKSLEGTISKYMALEFKVEKLTERTRAADIRVLKSEDVSPPIQKYLDDVTDKQHSSPSSSRRGKEPVVPVNTTDTQGREEGVITKLVDNDTYGFIKPDSRAYGKATIFFHRTHLVNKGTSPQIGDRVQFRVSESEKGLKANDIFVQSQFSSRWEHFIGRGIQQGSVLRTSDNGGIIKSNLITGRKSNLNFYFNDILNGNFPILPGTKVHFEVERRGGKCVAVRINVIGAPEGMPIGIPISTSNGAFLATYQGILPLQLNAGPLYLDPYGNRLEDVDRMDKLP